MQLKKVMKSFKSEKQNLEVNTVVDRELMDLLKNNTSSKKSSGNDSGTWILD